MASINKKYTFYDYSVHLQILVQKRWLTSNSTEPTPKSAAERWRHFTHQDTLHYEARALEVLMPLWMMVPQCVLVQIQCVWDFTVCYFVGDDDDFDDDPSVQQPEFLPRCTVGRYKVSHACTRTALFSFHYGDDILLLVTLAFPEMPSACHYYFLQARHNAILLQLFSAKLTL